MLKKINIYRRKITKTLTSKIDNPSLLQYNFRNLDRNAVKRVLISRPNHRLGNMLLITPLVQDVSTIFPNAKIDLFVKGTVAVVIFKNYKEVETLIKLPRQHFKNLGQYISCWTRLRRKKYDFVINCVEQSSSGRLSIKFSNATYKYYGLLANQQILNISESELKHIAKNPVYGFRNFLISNGLVLEKVEVPNLNVMLNESEIVAGESIVKELVEQNNKPTISIFTFATGDKCYSEEWWNEFYNLLIKSFPNYNILEILPVENVSQINFKAPFYYSKDIREITAVIANTAIFIGADSGMMHLASASQTTTFGLFKITVPDTYKPYGNGSLAIDTNICSMEDCIEKIQKILSKEQF